MIVLGKVLLSLILLLCIFSIVLGLPGEIILLGIVLVYGLINDFVTFGTAELLILAAAAALGQVGEFLLGYRVTARTGASRGANISSIVGGLVLGIAMAPIGFGLGALIGAFAGAWGGAFAWEYLATGGNTPQALSSARGAFHGRALGFLLRISLGIFMLIFTLKNLFWG